MKGKKNLDPSRARLLLASSSVVALLVGGAPAALAAPCHIIQSGGTASGLSNSSPTGNCILVESGATVTGNVTNTGTGVLTTNGTRSPSQTGITINASTVIGSVSNAGIIHATNDGILIDNNASVAGGVSNSGTISITRVFNAYGIDVANVTVFAGPIINSGLVQGGENGIFVGSVSTVSGGISNAGTISVGRIGIDIFGAGTFAGGISNAGTITGGVYGIDVSATASFFGGISNSGTISANVVGILVDGIGVNISNFSGGISNSGTISAGRTGISILRISTFTGNINNSGTIVAGSLAGGINVIASSTFTGGISNSGTISAVVGGIGIDVNDVAQFGTTSTGSGIINSGKISAGSTGIYVSASTFAGDISNSGTIVADVGIRVAGGSTFLGAIVNSGTITGTGGTAIDVSGAPNGMTIDILGGAISGNITGAGTTSGDTVNFALDGGSFTYANTIAGMQFVNLNSGTLFDSGTIAAADVTVNSGGTLAPGQPGTPGTLAINGNLAFNSGSAYEIQLTPSTHPFTTVSGTVTIGNSAVDFIPSGTLGTHYSASTFAILTSSGTLSGTFNPNVADTGVVQLSSTPTLSYDAHDAYLSYGNSYLDLATPAGANQSQQNVINGINNDILAGDTVPAGFQQLGDLSGAAYLNALTQLDGEDATGAETGAFQFMNEFLQLMQGQSFGGGGGGGSGGGLGFAPDEQADALPPGIALAYDSILKAPAKPQTLDQRWSAWGTGFGGTSITNGNAAVGSNTVTASTYGAAAGMEYRADPNTVLGFALAGGGLNWNLAQGLGTGRSDAFQAGVYGKSYWGPAYVSGALAFGNNWFTTNRTAMGDQLTANFTGQSYAARFEGGYRYAVPAQNVVIGVTPYAALQTQWFHTPAYSETDLTAGGGLGLAYASTTANDTRSELGARFDDLTTLNNTPLILRARLAWAHDWTSGTALNAAFEALPGSSFTVNGAAIPQNSALTTVSAQWWLTSNWSFTAKFDGEFAPTSQTYAGAGTLKYTW